MPFLPFPRFAALGAGAALAALALDQEHKYWMLNVFGIEARQPIHAAPFLDIVLSWNYGVSYSLFSAHEDAARFALIAVQAVIVAGLTIWMSRAARRLTALALGLVIGGALGNLGDRVVRGAVADFFFLHTQLPVGPLANYVFNVADVAITFGVVLLFVDGFFPEVPAKAEA